MRGHGRPSWRKYCGSAHLGGSAQASSPGRKCGGGLLTWASPPNLGQGWAGRGGAGRGEREAVGFYTPVKVPWVSGFLSLETRPGAVRTGAEVLATDQR